MKKVFFFTGLLFFLLACSKDKDLVNGGNDLSAKHTTGDKSLHDNDTVRISNSGFSPVNVKTFVDKTVVWVNDDNVTHTVTSKDFDSGDIPPGGKFEMSFHNEGSFDYFCKYHLEKGIVGVVAGTY